MPTDRAQQIVTAAETLMRDRGYSAFSYADIAEAVHIRKPSIHHHFPSKAGLAATVLRQHREKTLGGLHALDNAIEDPLKRLQAYVHFWENCIRDQSAPFCVAALLGAELPSLPEEVQAEVHQHFLSLAAWLERTLKAGVRAGALQLDASAAVEAQTLMALVHGAMLSARALSDCTLFRQVTGAALKRLTPSR